jgi:hypothetical protein
MKQRDHLEDINMRGRLLLKWKGKPEGKRPLGRPRHRQKNIRLDLAGVGYYVMDHIDLPQDGSCGNLL